MEFEWNQHDRDDKQVSSGNYSSSVSVRFITRLKYIIRYIIEAHGEEIMAENTVERKCAMFRFTLPAITHSDSYNRRSY